MDEAQHDRVLNLLRGELKIPEDGTGDSGHPVVALWRSADRLACKSLIAAFGQYANIQDQLEADQLLVPGLEVATIASRLQAVSRADKNNPDGKLRAWVRRISAQIKSPRKDAGDIESIGLQAAAVSRLAKCGSSSRLPDIAAALLKRDKSVFSFMKFLKATDNLAVALLAERPTDASPDFFLACYVRAHLGDDFRRRGSLLAASDGPLRYVHDQQVEIFAQAAYLRELTLHQSAVQEYPVDYLEPMGLSPALLAEFGFRVKPHYFSARLACAALMLSKSTPDRMPYCRWVIARFLRPHSARHLIAIDAASQWKASLLEFADSVYKFYTDSGTDTDRTLATEYDSAHQWRTTMGADGPTAGSAEALLCGTRNDADFVLKVFARIRQTKLGNVAAVAVASKLGTYFREHSEPSCKAGHGGKEPATMQVRKIHSLCDAVAAGISPKGSARFRNDIGIVQTAGRIYFKNWPSEAEVNDGFDWTRDPQPNWRLLKSDSHIETPEKVGAHLWLYGKRFQEVIDDLIDEVGSAYSADGQDYTGNGDRFTRFVFVVPQCNTEDKKLIDFPGFAPMRRVLHVLGRSGCIEGFSLQTELYNPIVLREPPVLGSTMFVSSL